MCSYKIVEVSFDVWAIGSTIESHVHQVQRISFEFIHTYLLFETMYAVGKSFLHRMWKFAESTSFVHTWWNGQLDIWPYMVYTSFLFRV